MWFQEGIKEISQEKFRHPGVQKNQRENRGRSQRDEKSELPI